MTPVLYSFRRCPYAMRARLAIQAAQTPVHLREILLRDKPAAFLAASASGTVPCLVLHDAMPDTTIDESLDIMIWALTISDPDGLMNMSAPGWDLIAQCDGPFKHALDRTKYATRYPDSDPVQHRNNAIAFLHDLDARIGTHIFDRPSIADLAIAPFVRQFAFIDKPWFDAQPIPQVQAWLAAFLASDKFARIMTKYPQWAEGDTPTPFPPAGEF